MVGGCIVGLLAAPLADVLLRARGPVVRPRQPARARSGRPGAARRVLLLRTDDALRFGQIYRALQRAAERSPSARR